MSRYAWVLTLGLWCLAHPLGAQDPAATVPTAAAPGDPAAGGDAAAAGGEGAGGDRLTFSDAPLDMVLKDYSARTGRTLLEAPSLPKANITLQSEGTLSTEEYLQAIETVLMMHGIALVPWKDKFLKVLQNKDAGKEGVPIQDYRTRVVEDEGGASREIFDPLADTPGLVSQMIQLKHVPIEEAKQAIELFRHPYGQVQLFERSNGILVTDTPGNVNQMIEVLKYIDFPVQPKEVPNILPIRFAKASEIKGKLEEIIAETQKDQKGKPSNVPQPKTAGSPGVIKPSVAGVIRATRTPEAAAPSAEPSSAELIEMAERGIIVGDVKIVADDRTNILIILTREENMTFFEKIVKVLDVETAPDVEVRVFRLEFADSETVAGMLNDLIGAAGSKADVAKGTGKDKPTEGSATPESKKLSEYVEAAPTPAIAAERKSKMGELSKENIKILADKRTNALIIMASRNDLKTIEEIIGDMDIMLSQVLIEVVIFKVDLGDTLDRGVDWVQRALVTYDQKAGGLAPKAGYAGALGGNSLRGAMQDPMGMRTLDSAKGIGGNLSYMFTFFDLNLDGVLRMLQSDNRTKVLSSPVILTTDNKESSINVTSEKYFYQGTKYVPTGAVGNVAPVADVVMKKVGTKLSVTPHINEKKFVAMEIKQSLEEEGATQKIEDQEWPTIDSSEVNASVAVRSGETIVLGGLVVRGDRKSRSGVPWIGRVPVVGWLFSSKSDTESRKEIVVFITPYVLNNPEDIELETRRRKESVDIKGMWPKGWSASEMAEEDGAEHPPKQGDALDAYKQKMLRQARERVRLQELGATSAPEAAVPAPAPDATVPLPAAAVTPAEPVAPAANEPAGREARLNSVRARMDTLAARMDQEQAESQGARRAMDEERQSAEAAWARAQAREQELAARETALAAQLQQLAERNEEAARKMEMADRKLEDERGQLKAELVKAREAQTEAETEREALTRRIDGLAVLEQQMEEKNLQLAADAKRRQELDQRAAELAKREREMAEEQRRLLRLADGAGKLEPSALERIRREEERWEQKLQELDQQLAEELQVLP